ncbi:hypothetical protein EXIGLDRAFT_759739 [Exidia glandulosa HHB12029]|uniref:Uncharacterized protein n=1 Tax=Exidia glandulosa HHB12029 TaxID=1314781 RepID=A0A165PSR2_EXIGL|nr:hypothetical protein EXIGLDRAFT_759739 [Exidia glandulosa HHB12029]
MLQTKAGSFLNSPALKVAAWCDILAIIQYFFTFTFNLQPTNPLSTPLPHLRKMSSFNLASLHTLTVAGGVEYFTQRLLLVQQEQNTVGFSLPQAPRAHSSFSDTSATPLLSFETITLESSGNTTTESTTLVTPTDEKPAPTWNSWTASTLKRRETEQDSFEGEGELEDDKSIWLTNFKFT